MPEGPRADLLEVVERLTVISSTVIGAKSRTGLGAGSSGSAAGTGLGTVGKNRSERTWRMLVWDVAKDPSNFRRGGNLVGSAAVAPCCCFPQCVDCGCDEVVI